MNYLNITGPAGAGKTTTAILVANHLLRVEKRPVVVFDFNLEYSSLKFLELGVIDSSGFVVIHSLTERETLSSIRETCRQADVPPLFILDGYRRIVSEKAAAALPQQYPESMFVFVGTE